MVVKAVQKASKVIGNVVTSVSKAVNTAVKTVQYAANAVKNSFTFEVGVGVSLGGDISLGSKKVGIKSGLSGYQDMTIRIKDGHIKDGVTAPLGGGIGFLVQKVTFS